MILADHADVTTFPSNKIGMIPFSSSDFYHFRNLEMGDNENVSVSYPEISLSPFIHFTLQDEPDICLKLCLLHNRYMSDDRSATHLRWCDKCEHWVHERCAGQAMQRGDITPSENQSYLKADILDAKRNAMPSDVQVLLEWPICRLSKEFTVEKVTYWHPHSMELVVKMARKWYHAGSVPENWEQEVTDIHEDTNFMQSELQALLNAPCPQFYGCPKCSSYI